MNRSTQKRYKTRRLSFLIKVNDSRYSDTYMNIPRFECSANMWIRAVVLFKVLIVTVEAVSNDFEVTKNQIQQLELDLAVQKSMNAQLRAGLYHSRLNRGYAWGGGGVYIKSCFLFHLRFFIANDY